VCVCVSCPGLIVVCEEEERVGLGAGEIFVHANAADTKWGRLVWLFHPVPVVMVCTNVGALVCVQTGENQEEAGDGVWA